MTPTLNNPQPTPEPDTHRTFTVDIATWYRGRGPATSCLLRPDGFRCCLGHVLAQCGYTDHEIFTLASPIRVEDHRKLPSWFIKPEEFGDQKYNSDDIGAAMKINDNVNLSDTERMSLLREIFARHDCELLFIDSRIPSIQLP